MRQSIKVLPMPNNTLAGTFALKHHKKGKKTMKHYQEPILNILLFSDADVLTLSNNDKGGEDLDWE